MVIELKYAEDAAFDDICREALKQIKVRGHEEPLIDDGKLSTDMALHATKNAVR